MSRETMVKELAKHNAKLEMDAAKKAKEIEEAQAAMAELEAEFYAIMAEDTTAKFTATNGVWYQYLDQELDVTLTSITKVIRDHVSKNCTLLGNVVFTFNVNGKDINYSIIRAQVKLNKESGKFECKDYQMHQFLINGLFRAINEYTDDAIIGRNFKVVFTTNENNYKELKVLAAE